MFAPRSALFSALKDQSFGGSASRSEVLIESIGRAFGGHRRDLESNPLTSLQAQDLRAELVKYTDTLATHFKGANSLDRAAVRDFFAQQSEPVSISKAHYQKIFGDEAVWFMDSSILADIKAREERLKGQIYGTTPAKEATIVLETARAIQPRVVLVIGTHLGIQSADILKNCPDSIVISLDILPSWVGKSIQLDSTNRSYIENVGLTDATVGSEISKLPEEMQKRHFQLFGNSQEVLKSGAALAEALKGLGDMVIVDGNHRMHEATQDICSALNILSPGGVITVDDYMKPPRLLGVTTAVQLVSSYCTNELQDLLRSGFHAQFLPPANSSKFQFWYVNGFEPTLSPPAQPSNMALITLPAN